MAEPDDDYITILAEMEVMRDEVPPPPRKPVAKRIAEEQLDPDMEEVTPFQELPPSPVSQVVEELRATTVGKPKVIVPASPPRLTQSEIQAIVDEASEWFPSSPLYIDSDEEESVPVTQTSSPL